MTEYFEIHERDSAARLGELRLDEPVTTPALVDELREDAGSQWTPGDTAVEGDESTLTILPHRAFPGGTPEEVEEAFATEYPDVDVPSAAVVSPGTATDHGTDAYVLSNAQELAGHARAFVEAIIETREAIPADTALYLPGVATPGNVATLAYAGVDLFDTDQAVLEGLQGKYLGTDGEAFLEDLTELPCACPACQRPRSEFDREDCAEHNEHALRAALGTVRERIRSGRLRDYIEGQARHEQWLTAVFRRLDQQYGHLEQRTPVLRRNGITAATDDTLRRVEIQRYAERVTNRYRNRFDAPLVLVPCSARKPYSDSQSHAQFHDAIQYRGHLVSMTSPIGVVPQELELTYPAQHYDSVVTGEWTATEIEFVSDVLAAYLRRNEYPRHIAHVPEDYRPICERAAEKTGVEFEYTVSDHPTTADSLANLASTLADEPKYRKRERQHNTVRAIADYQFGEGAGAEIFDELSVESRYPKLRATDDDGEQLAMLVPEYGLLAFTIAGARRWVDSAAPTKRVEIDAFVPHGSVLAPGVVDASESIRVGDEVVIEGPKAFAVGRAKMSGPEMVESTRGIASSVRHLDER
ncbi:tRNA-ribosyltransferase [Halovenus sp. WSH3]|uniref:tRNA-ribosyltransferase n=1 Tax=Halovenus carboxidivorans TaxID=2692199 RepID=A0A6B0T4I0_9EURY|nr:archaeosine synthase subunit alpha [Halovenus carboxidivorans]MXR53168.1 tRNA-ribosyltransferase [Halovenus carboxidivorans]